MIKLKQRKANLLYRRDYPYIKIGWVGTGVFDNIKTGRICDRLHLDWVTKQHTYHFVNLLMNFQMICGSDDFATGLLTLAQVALEKDLIAEIVR